MMIRRLLRRLRRSTCPRPDSATCGLYRTASAFAAEWADSMTLVDIAPRLTCMETETLAALLRELGFDDAADLCIDRHAQVDDDEDDMHFVAPGAALAETP